MVEHNEHQQKDEHEQTRYMMQ